ncbi:hypothetical protein CJF31_00011492 [Rutstroemia sp. NJR-2017a BVV2]|nr:hypothetical protein CJF31_00011492 [Rutstroemia sp. NJR-2017a BVV2]
MTTTIQQKLQLKPYIKSFSTTPNHKMPLVDPVTNSAGGNADKTQSMTMEWMNKLAGKTIGDQSNETTFAKKDLPEKHRIIEPGMMVTKDFDENSKKMMVMGANMVVRRLNIHVKEDGTVSHVDHQ